MRCYAGKKVKHTLLLILMHISLVPTLSNAMSTTEILNFYERAEYPLHLAAKLGHPADIKALLTYHDIDKEDDQERTALHCAAQQGNLKACKVLIRAGQNIFAKDADGRLPLNHDTLHHYSIFLTTAPSITPVFFTIMAMQKYRKASLWHRVPKDIIKEHLIPYIIFNAVETQLTVATKLLSIKQSHRIGECSLHNCNEQTVNCTLKEAAERLRNSTDMYPILDPEKVEQHRDAIKKQFARFLPDSVTCSNL